MEPTTQYTSNEAMQLLVIHYLYKEHNIGLTLAEIKQLELTVIDEWEELSAAYKRLLTTSNKLSPLFSTISSTSDADTN